MLGKAPLPEARILEHLLRRPPAQVRCGWRENNSALRAARRRVDKAMRAGRISASPVKCEGVNGIPCPHHDKLLAIQQESLRSVRRVGK